MSILLGIVSEYGTLMIIILGAIIGVWLMINASALANQKETIAGALNGKSNIYTLHGKTKNLEEAEDEKARVTPDTIRGYEMEFNKKCSTHNILVQLIPLFPLFGIFGTVAGLMLELQGGDINAMMSSLDVALETTLWGLFFAIALKGIEAVYPSRVIYDVEVMLDDFDKKVSIAEMFEKLKEE